MTKINLGLFHSQSIQQLIINSSEGRNQEPETEADAEAHRRMLLTGLLHMAYSTCFLTEPRTTTTSTGMATPMAGVITLGHFKN